MEIIEKEVIKEPKKEYASKGVAGTGLGLGIAGTALGLLALNNGGGFGLFGGNRGYGMPQNVNINTDSASSVLGSNTPTAFQVWEKNSEDNFDMQKSLYQLALGEQSQRFNDRQSINRELFGIYKSQIDSDFNLYKSQRDGFDVLTAKHNKDSFDLYKGQRDNFDILNNKINTLATQVAVNSAIRPYQDRLIQCEIDKAYTAGINYTDRKTCRMITGQLVIPTEPIVTGIGSYNPCCVAQPAEE